MHLARFGMKSDKQGDILVGYLPVCQLSKDVTNYIMEEDEDLQQLSSEGYKLTIPTGDFASFGTFFVDSTGSQGLGPRLVPSFVLRLVLRLAFFDSLFVGLFVIGRRHFGWLT